jgi:hypothetical protein
VSVGRLRAGSKEDNMAELTGSGAGKQWLRGFLTFSAPRGVRVGADPPMAMGRPSHRKGRVAMPNVFVSHASRDCETITQAILPLLTAHGIKYWYSAKDIPSASDWEKVIRHALTTCDWFLVVLSPSAIESEWVQAEVHWALDHRQDHFISLLLNDCTPSDLHLKLIRYQHIDFRRPSDEACRRLVEALGVSFRNPLSVYVQCSVNGSPRVLAVNGTAMIGRAAECEIVLADSAVSQRHALLKVRNRDGVKSVWLCDLGSANGVRLNGAALKEIAELRIGDEIAFFPSVIRILSIGDREARSSPVSTEPG